MATGPRYAHPVVVRRGIVAQETIGSSILFIGLTPEEKAEIASFCEPLHYHPGQSIVREGEQGDALFLLAAGRVEVVAHAGQPGERIVQVLDGGSSLEASYAGAFFGEMSLVDIEPRSATVRAQTEVSLARLSAFRISDFFATHRDAQLAIITNIARVLSRRLRLVLEKA
jgi:CRP-like cAMP-binding protein